MKFKTKIALSYFSLLLLLLLVGALSIANVRKLETAASNILKDNLYTLKLGKRMITALDNMHIVKQQSIFIKDTSETHFQLIKNHITIFEKNLSEEKENITEPGEGELVQHLSESFTDYKSLLLNPNLSPVLFQTQLLPRYQQLRNQLDQINSLNIEALERKNAQARATAKQTRHYTLGAISLAILLGICYSIIVPAALTKPIKRFIASIQAVATKDFSIHLPVRGKDELSLVAKAYNTMLQRLKEYESSNFSELLTQKKRIELIVQNLDEGILLLDQNLKLIEANPIACKLLGMERSSLIGLQSQELEGKSDLFRELVKEIMIGKTSDDRVLAITDSGEEVYYRRNLLEIVSYNELTKRSEFFGYVISLRNVSDFKRLDQVKSNFLATVSHELKTPLASIGYSLKLLQDERIGGINTEQKSLLGTIKAETTRLQKMVSGLIDVARLEEGNIQLNIQEVEVTEIIRYSEEAIRLQMLPKDLRLLIDLENNLAKVLADVEKTTWVLINLLSNAIRFSPEKGEITISTHCEGDKLFIKVHDNGPGIRPADFNKIFQKFTQLPGEPEHGGGVGLGLAISQEFIQSQGGTLWVESSEGKGSTFIFSLPLSGIY